MDINLKDVPFSYRRSYMSISYCDLSYQGTTREGLFLRSIHGSSRRRNVCRLVPMVNGMEAEYTITADASLMTMHTQEGMVKVCFADDENLLIQGIGEHIGLRMDEISDGSGYNYLHPLVDGDYSYTMLNAFTSICRYLIHGQSGTLSPRQEWKAEKAGECALEITVVENQFLISIKEVPIEWRKYAYHYDYDFDFCVLKNRILYEKFLHKMPAVPSTYSKTMELAAYINWSALVKPFGLLKRESMLMSKNWMCSVWSWDHCFNAMSLAYGYPELAWDQFMLMFDYQDETGVIPDSVNDAIIIHNFCKPPIHGWALSHILKVMKPSREQLEEVYLKLSRLTEWWLDYRDHDDDGICEYFHGNDSGWDNSTAFRELPPMELPDLNAFLIVQMDVLSDMARRLGETSDYVDWKCRADDMLEALCEHCFQDGMPIAVHNGSHLIVENDSLIMYLPILLGKRLPEQLRVNMVKVLKSDKFLTKYGMATESPSSDLYVSDGYWRGPIWAPSTMLIVDGLRRCGAESAAWEVARRFCDMVQKSGCAENFDALTGEGLRDRAYTWTASVFMILAHEYLY